MMACSEAAKLVVPDKCQNGCKLDEDCVLYSECKLLDVKDICGFCVCRDGYKAQGSKCVEIKGFTTTTASTTTTTTTQPSTTTETTTTTQETTTTTTQTTSTSTVPTTTGTTTQGPPPTPDPVNCPDFACSVFPPSDGSDNPMQVRSRLVNTSTDPNCKRQLVIQPRPCNMQGGGSCYGIYCLNVSPGNDYCICPYYKTDRQCAVDKPGSCDAATGQVPTGMTVLQNKRLRNPSNKDNGSVYGRHFAANLQDCVKLCQWSKGACRSVNYGTINGAQVCEMLSTAATSSNLLSKWLEDASGWQYAQVQQAFL